MKIDRTHFDRAVECTGLTAEQGAELWSRMEESRTGSPLPVSTSSSMRVR
ncbi:MAG: hypothetical protein ACMVO3_10235 [Thalassobaculum sp.]